MAQTPSEPTNLVLEHLRVMRAEIAQIDSQVKHIQSDISGMKSEMSGMKADISSLKADVSDVKKDMRGFKLNTIAEIYKANLTVASFVDHEQRIPALERKLP